jgi:16S rRNA processing protein RimM
MTEIIDGAKKGKLIILKLANIDNRELAQKYIGADILLPTKCLPELESGHYYWRDLEGLSVINDKLEKLGIVSKLMETGADDVMVVQGSKQILIPFIMNKVIKKVDLKARHIIVDWEWVD